MGYALGVQSFSEEIRNDVSFPNLLSHVQPYEGDTKLGGCLQPDVLVAHILASRYLLNQMSQR